MAGWSAKAELPHRVLQTRVISATWNLVLRKFQLREYLDILSSLFKNTLDLFLIMRTMIFA